MVCRVAPDGTGGVTLRERLPRRRQLLRASPSACEEMAREARGELQKTRGSWEETRGLQAEGAHGAEPEGEVSGSPGPGHCGGLAAGHPAGQAGSSEHLESGRGFRTVSRG